MIGLAPEHVAWVRRTFPHAGARSATLPRLARDLRPGPEPLGVRVAALGLEAVELEPWEEVIDPGGGDAPEFEACARRIVDLVDALTPALSDTGRTEPRGRDPAPTPGPEQMEGDVHERLDGQRCLGRVALVTGASRGIGAAIARRLASEGAVVACAARTLDLDPRYQGTLAETVATITGDGGRAHAFHADLS